VEQETHGTDNLLARAARAGRPSAVKWLLSQPAMPVDAQNRETITVGNENLTRGDGGTAVHLAARLGHIDVLHELLVGGAAIDAKDADGGSPLHTAAINGQPEAVRTLLAMGAKVDGPDALGRTALVHAASGGHVETTRALIDGGSSAVGSWIGALTAASDGGRIEVFQLLEARVSKQTGMEVQHSPTGETYIGEFSDGKRHGRGRATWPNGMKYVGEWEDDARSGTGILRMPTGHRCIGAFKGNQLHGEATCTSPTGEEFVGEWRDDKRWQGRLKVPDGRRFVFEQGEAFEVAA
jgi:hypothetical protein